MGDPGEPDRWVLPVEEGIRSGVLLWTGNRGTRGVARRLFIQELLFQRCPTTLKRAKQALGIRSIRIGGLGKTGKWMWALPDDQLELEE